MNARYRFVIAGIVVIALMIGVRQYFFRSPVQTDISAPLPTEKVPEGSGMGFKLLPTKNSAFKAGEKLHYNIIFKGVTVGHATIEITDGPLVNGRPTLKYISKANSNHFFDFFFKVRDENVSTVDKESLFSFSFDQNLHEGNYAAVRRYDFDYNNKKFTSVQKKKGNIKKAEGPLNAPLYDVLSALYFARTLTLTPGHDLSLSIYRDKSGKELPIKIGSSLKTQKTPLGTFSCLRVEPIIQGDSIFKSKDGGLVVWMTNDENKLPVLMEANASVGIVRVKLTKWEK